MLTTRLTYQIKLFETSFLNQLTQSIKWISVKLVRLDHIGKFKKRNKHRLSLGLDYIAIESSTI